VTMSLEELVERPHVIVARARVNELVDATLAAHGLRRRIGVVADSDLVVPHLMQGTDLVGLALGRTPDDQRLRPVLLPFTLATSTFHLWWSASAEADAGQHWFLDRILGSTRVGDSEA
jgi:hypothetical protein